MNRGTKSELQSADRARLEACWIELTRVRLPDLARERSWPIRNDHCFQRVILDTLFDGVWYDRVPGRPAYKMVDTATLKAGIRLAERLVAGDLPLEPLNARSLRWRSERKRAKAQGDGSKTARPLL